MHACLAYSWVPVCSGHTVPRDTGDGSRRSYKCEAPVPVPGGPVYDGLQALLLWSTCVRGRCSDSKVTLLIKKSPIYCTSLEYYIHVIMCFPIYLRTQT